MPKTGQLAHLAFHATTVSQQAELVVSIVMREDILQGIVLSQK